MNYQEITELKEKEEKKIKKLKDAKNKKINTLKSEIDDFQEKINQEVENADFITACKSQIQLRQNQLRILEEEKVLEVDTTQVQAETFKRNEEILTEIKGFEKEVHEKINVLLTNLEDKIYKSKLEQNRLVMIYRDTQKEVKEYNKIKLRELFTTYKYEKKYDGKIRVIKMNGQGTDFRLDF